MIFYTSVQITLIAC